MIHKIDNLVLDETQPGQIGLEETGSCIQEKREF